MKKILSIKEVTTTFGKSDIQLYKEALADDSKRINFLMCIFDILESAKDQEECEKFKLLLDEMVDKLYQKSVVKKAILHRINYVEEKYMK